MPPQDVAVRTDPGALPGEPQPSDGLLDLASDVARRALALGLGSREPSFHVFVACEPEAMVEHDLVRFAERVLAGRPVPDDLLYVHDFDRPEAPKPLRLPAGVGGTLVAALDGAIEALKEAIPQIALTDEVRAAQVEMARQLEAKSREVVTGLESTAKGLGFGVRSVQGGVQTFPILHGKPLTAEQFGALDESTKRALGEAEARLTEEVEKAARLVRDETAKVEAKRDEALSQVAEVRVRAAVAPLREAFARFGDEVSEWLAAVERALVEDWDDLVESPGRGGGGPAEQEDSEEGGEHDPEHARRLGRFKVNLLASHAPPAAEGEGAPRGAGRGRPPGPPVVYETNPTYPNLFGYLERRARYGALLTDFTRIRPGSLHRASGGVLVVRVQDLMTDPIIWERMKRVLREQRISPEDPLGPLGLYATTLRPVPVPVQVRVVLVGTAHVYAQLLDADPDFAALFRVKVELEPSIPKTRESVVALDGYLMQLAKERGWGEFDAGARAKLVDYATRLSGDRDRLGLIVAPLEETAAFASTLAELRGALARPSRDAAAPPARESRSSLAPARESQRTLAPVGRESRPTLLRARDRSTPALESSRGAAARAARRDVLRVTAEDVEQAWADRRLRAGSAERHIREMTVRGEVAVETQGSRVGVVNGLSVLSAGDVEFGQPMRITAVVALGREGIIDVEREAQLGGSIHTKGIAIVRGYLSKVFGQERPLSLRAQIAFEQSYGEIDGDSASAAELFAVLSALADLPIDQSIAVTGSVNQLGEVQAVGGVPAKIEGFFDLCEARGLTGQQGVLLPRSNLRHLVLRDDVARAVAEGRFALYAIASVEEGIEILTSVSAGARDGAGRFPASSVFGRVERRIIEIAERLREAEGPGVRGGETLDDGGDVSTTDLGDSADFRRR